MAPEGSNGVDYWIIITVAVLASAMVFLDSTALGVAIPAIQIGLNATGPQVLWIQNAYALPLTALLLSGGALGDQFGRKPVFAIGVGVFAVASAFAGVATDTGLLIAARAAQGCGGALMLPGALGMIVSYVPRALHGRAIAKWSALSALATVAGPVLGGVLSQAGWWRTVFWINHLSRRVSGCFVSWLPCWPWRDSYSPGMSGWDPLSKN
jgi:MFS family permease